MVELQGRQAAQRLRGQRDRIVDEFCRRARERLPAARDLAQPALTNTLPVMVGEFADAVEGRESLSEVMIRERSLGRAHGEIRALLATYDLDQLLAEYGLIAEVVLETLEEEGPIARQVREMIVRLVQQSVRGAVAEFVRAKEQERSRLDAERQAIAEIVARQKRRYDALLAATDDPVFALDAAGRLTYANRACARLARSTPEALVGQPLRVLCENDADAERLRGDLARALGGERTVAVVELPTPAGRRRFETVFTLLSEEAGAGREVVGVARDVEDRARLVAALEEEHQARERFVVALTHDLRTPLAGARANAELAQRSLTRPERVPALLGRVVEGIDRAARMIQELLSAVRLHAGEPLALAREPFDLGALVEEVVAEAHTVHGERFVVEREGALKGEWNREGLRRVLENLVGNAVKYGAEGAPVRLAVRALDGGVRLAVHNEGNPIAPEDQGRLFQPFRRTAGALASGHSGWGIGLALVRGVVEAHGGQVSVESSSEDGTTFVVTLPR